MQTIHILRTRTSGVESYIEKDTTILFKNTHKTNKNTLVCNPVSEWALSEISKVEVGELLDRTFFIQALNRNVGK